MHMTLRQGMDIGIIARMIDRMIPGVPGYSSGERRARGRAT